VPDWRTPLRVLDREMLPGVSFDATGFPPVRNWLPADAHFDHWRLQTGRACQQCSAVFPAPCDALSLPLWHAEKDHFTVPNNDWARADRFISAGRCPLCGTPVGAVAYEIDLRHDGKDVRRAPVVLNSKTARSLGKAGK